MRPPTPGREPLVSGRAHRPHVDVSPRSGRPQRLGVARRPTAPGRGGSGHARGESRSTGARARREEPRRTGRACPARSIVARNDDTSTSSPAARPAARPASALRSSASKPTSRRFLISTFQHTHTSSASARVDFRGLAATPSVSPDRTRRRGLSTVNTMPARRPARPARRLLPASRCAGVQRPGRCGYPVRERADRPSRPPRK